jgi:hypothetical protein
VRELQQLGYQAKRGNSIRQIWLGKWIDLLKRARCPSTKKNTLWMDTSYQRSGKPLFEKVLLKADR